MSTTAEPVLEQDILARVHRDTVVLVVHSRILDHHTVGIVNVECIRVVAKRFPILELIAGSIVANEVLYQ